ncbi:dihydrolipoamide acetyltransferase family protein [Mycobacterium sp. Dal123C01]|uniref:dihydrolipoamide acetyltransferase family protein n=1 Tax=Mycobacterium sp. Dal123C01 TaxID=3457577 RepID=UPI00403E3DE3
MTGPLREFFVPDLGEGLRDVTISEWNVAVGDDVELNHKLCTVETNKAEVEIPTPYAGRIVELGGQQGATLDVGALLVAIATAPVVDVSPGPAATAGVDTNGVVPKRSPLLVGYGSDREMDVGRRWAGRPGRPKAKPPVRKLAAELNVDLTVLSGSGPQDVITREDVLRAAELAAGHLPTVEVGGVQAQMAARMMRSHLEIPDATAAVQADCSGLIRLRDRLGRAGGEDGVEFTPFVLMLRLVTIALIHHPILNSSWIDAVHVPQIHLHRAVHLGFGVATPRGLLVPVLRDAQAKTLRELAIEVARLIDGARAATLKPSELSASTFTVSNFGSLGLDDGTPVINHPEAAILGMGKLMDRPVVVDGVVVARPTMTVTCSFDHRIVDGAQAAGFLRELCGLLEAPETALLDL